MRNRSNNSGGGRPSRNASPAKGNFKSGGSSTGGGFGARKAKPAAESRFSKPSIKKSSLRAATSDSQPKRETFKQREDFDLSADEARSMEKGAGRPTGFQGKKEGGRGFEGGRSFKPEFKKDFKSGKPERKEFGGSASGKPWGDRDSKPAFKREDKPERKEFGGSASGKPWGDRDSKPAFKREDRPERKEFGGSAAGKTWGDRDSKPAFKREDRPERREFSGERKFNTDRPARNFDDKQTNEPRADGLARRVGRFDRAPRYNLEGFEDRGAKKKRKGRRG